MTSLIDLLNNYLDSIRSLNYSHYSIRTAHFNVIAFLRYLKDYFFVETADKIRQHQLEEWLNHLNAHRTTKGRPLHPKSINKRIENVRGYFKYLLRHGFIQRRLIDYLVYVKEPKMLPGSVLTHTQTKQLLRQINTTTPTGHRDRAMVELLYSGGIRAGELLGLNISDINLKERTVRVMGKGRKERIVPIGATACRYLESYIVAVRSFLVRNREETALFLNHNGARLPYFTLRKLVHFYADNANMTVNVTPHTFRRSCTTELIRGGADLYHVKEILGHDTLETLKAYTQLTIIDLKKTHVKCHPRERDT